MGSPSSDQNQVADLQPGPFRGAVGVDLGDPHAVQARAAELLGQIAGNRLRRDGQPRLLCFEAGIFEFLDADPRPPSAIAPSCEVKPEPRRHGFRFARW